MLPDRQVLIGFDIRHFLGLAARPLNFYGGRSIGAQAEGQREIARRAIRRPAVHRLRLRAACAGYARNSADTVPIALGSFKAQMQPVIADCRRRCGKDTRDRYWS